MDGYAGCLLFSELATLPRPFSAHSMISVGSSELGIGIQVAVLMPGKDDFDGATVYLSRDEAREILERLEDVLGVRT